MPRQFDVCRNPGRSRAVVPYVLVVQSNQFSASARRVVAPLIAVGGFSAPESEAGPRFVIDGQMVAMDPLQLANLPTIMLGEPVASLAHDEARILRAMDEMLSTAWN